MAGTALADTTLTVCPGGSCDHTSIQAAVDAASAGDTIEVQPGTYDEQVHVSKDLTIDASDGAELTRSDAPGDIGDNSFMLVDGGANVTLEGLTFQGPFVRSNTAGIFVTGDASLDASDLTMNQMMKVRNGQPSGAQFHNGIVVGDQRFTDNPGAGSLELSDSTIDEFGKSAVTVTGPDSSADLDNVTISGSGVLLSQDGTPAQDTLLLDAGASLELTDSSISDVRFEHPSFTAGTGVSLFGDADATIEGNTFENVAKPVSVQAFRSFDNTPGAVEGLTYEDNEISGAFAGLESFSENVPEADADSTVLRNSTVQNNVFADSELGVVGGFGLGGTFEDVTIADNTFRNNDLHAVHTDRPFDMESLLANNTFDQAALNVDDGSAITPSLADAVDGASTGDTIRAAGGPFDENLDVDTDDLTLEGKDEPTITQTVKIAADGVRLESLHVTDNPHFGVRVEEEIEDLTLDQVRITDTRNGFRVGTTGGVDGLTITDSTFKENSIGVYFNNDPNFVDDVSTLGDVTDVTIQETAFVDHERKGLYMEKLDDAVLANITVRGVTSDTYGFNNGIDINLKAGSYENITIQDSVIEEVSKGTPFLGIDSFSAAVVVKARDDPSRYDTHPATLDDVRIENNEIRDSFNGLRVGEPGVDYSVRDSPTNVVLRSNEFMGFQGYALENVGQNTIEAAHNWWDFPTGPDHEQNPLNGTDAPIGEPVHGNADLTPWCVTRSCIANDPLHDLFPHPGLEP